MRLVLIMIAHSFGTLLLLAFTRHYPELMSYDRRSSSRSERGSWHAYICRASR